MIRKFLKIINPHVLHQTCSQKTVLKLGIIQKPHCKVSVMVGLMAGMRTYLKISLNTYRLIKINKPVFDQKGQKPIMFHTIVLDQVFQSKNDICLHLFS